MIEAIWLFLITFLAVGIFLYNTFWGGAMPSTFLEIVIFMVVVVCIFFFYHYHRYLKHSVTTTKAILTKKGWNIMNPGEFHIYTFQLPNQKKIKFYTAVDLDDIKIGEKVIIKYRGNELKSVISKSRTYG